MPGELWLVSVSPPVLHAGSAERRRRIVDAALQLFSETDYGAVQMDDVATLAGVAKPTLYRYFPTKEALFLEGIERLLSELQHEVEQAEREPATADVALRAVIRCVFNALAQCTAAIRAFDGGENQIGERGRSVIRSRVRSIRVVVERILGRGVQEGVFRGLDVEGTAVAILGAVRMSAAQATTRKRSQALRALITFVECGVAEQAHVLDVDPQPYDHENGNLQDPSLHARIPSREIDTQDVD
jgi:AcrR family transcriptional regulator